jgi:hypothetical protein
MMDPYIFGRGSWNDVKDIRMTITYDSETNKRVVRSDINQKQLNIFEEKANY